MSGSTVKVNKLLDAACHMAGGRNKLTGLLNITTQQFENFRRKGEVSLPCAIKLSYLTGIPWQQYSPELTIDIEKLPQLNK